MNQTNSNPNFSQNSFLPNSFKNYQNQNTFENISNSFQFNNRSNTNQNNSENDEFSLLHTLQYVKDRYPNLININTNSAGVKSHIRNESSPRFFVIKSFTEEDIHKVFIFKFSL